MSVSIMSAVSLMMASFAFGILFVYTLVNIIESKRSKKDHENSLSNWIDCREHTPVDDGKYLVACGSNGVIILNWDKADKQWSKYGVNAEYWTMSVLYWQDVPQAPEPTIDVMK